MRPANLHTRIFLDSGDPKETEQALEFLGFLDGQTTNPSLIAKNPEAEKRIAEGKKFSKSEVLDFYQTVVENVSSLIPQGSISIEVYADKNTPAENMLNEGRQFFKWIPNAHIKFPITEQGLLATQRAIAEGIRVNLTLCFSQEQAAAVYSVTRGQNKGNVFVSPFVGRLDDIGENGMDLIKNIMQLYKNSDRHTEVLTASIRSLDHLLYSFALGSDIATVPFKVLKEWAESGFKMPDDNFNYKKTELKPIFYEDLDLNRNWRDFNIEHNLTDKGLEKFSLDWNKMIIS